MQGKTELREKQPSLPSVFSQAHLYFQVLVSVNQLLSALQQHSFCLQASSFLIHKASLSGPSPAQQFLLSCYDLLLILPVRS